MTTTALELAPVTGPRRRSAAREDSLHTVRGISLQCGDDVTVGVQGQADLRVAEGFHDQGVYSLQEGTSC